MKKRSLFFMLSIVIFACKNDDDTGPQQVIFTYSAGLNGATSDVWFIARDYESGELLDAQPVLDYQAVTLKTNKEIPSNKLSITWFRVTGTGNSRSIYADVYNGVNVGEKWDALTTETDPDRGLVYSEPTSKIGTYKLSITDVPSVYALSVSDSFGTISQNMALVGNTLSGDVDIHDEIKTHFVSIDIGSGSPKYALVSNFTPGENIEISYDDFQAYEDVINVQFNKTKFAYVNVYGYTNGFTTPSYMVYDNSGWGFYRGDEKTQLNLGFTDVFKNYTVQVSLGDFYYSKRGAPPTAIDYVSSDNFNVTNTTLDGYAATSSIDYLYRTVEYDYRDPDSGIRTSVVYYESPSGTKHNDPLTPDLMRQFAIPNGGLIYHGSSFYVKGATFENFLASQFNHGTVIGESARAFK